MQYYQVVGIMSLIDSTYIAKNLFNFPAAFRLARHHWAEVFEEER